MENQIDTSADLNFQILDLWNKYKHFWPWFVLSIAICCGIAYLRIKNTPNLYVRTAVIMIKDDRFESNISESFGLSVASLFSNVRNEVEVFRSHRLAQEVVRRLNLNISYTYQVNRFRTLDLYGRSPVEVSFPETPENAFFEFNLEFAPDSSVTLSNFVFWDAVVNESVRGRFGDTINTPVGKLVVTPTWHHGADWYFTPIVVGHHNVESSARGFLGGLEVHLSRDNAIITLVFIDMVIQRAADFLNALIDVYDEYWIYENNKIAVATLQFVNERLELAEQELIEIDEELEFFKRQHLLTDIQAQANLYLMESRTYSARSLEVSHQLALTNFIMDELRRDNGVNTTLPVNIGLSNSAIESQIFLFNTQLMERDRLIVQSSERNPVIEQINNQLTSLRRTITQAVENQIQALSMQLSSLQAQEAQIARNIESNPLQVRQLVSIERERNLKESVFLLLLQKKEETELALATSETNTRIIDHPSGSNSPVAPKRKLAMLVALFIGGAIPSSVIFGREFLDTTIRDKSDLGGLSMPFLGIIPQVKSSYLKNGALLVHEKGRDVHNESFRMVRTNLDAMCGKDVKVVMFTSLESRTGKTFTALNLAMTLAVAGKKVALVDLDMRKATLSRMISLPVQGISYFLNGMVSEERYIVQRDYLYPGFDLIPVGEIPYNPSELLMSENLQIFLEKLKKSYDYVFLDSTPLEMVADATIVGKHADLTVFVIREGHTNRRKISELEKRYKKGQFKNMVCILNGSKEGAIYDDYNTYSDDKKANNVIQLPPRSLSLPGKDKTKYLTGGSKTNHM